MAGKKKKSELELLKAEVTSLSEAVWALRDRLTVQAAADAAEQSAARRTPTPNGHGADAGFDTLARHARTGGQADAVSTYGYYEAGDRGYRWAREDVPVADLFALDDGRAAQLLSALGHRQRLAILKVILERPRTAVELVELLSLGTTGAAYHHLNVLQAADLVVQEGRGIFAIHGRRVQGFLTLLASIADMLDPTHAAAPIALAETDMTGEDGAG